MMTHEGQVDVREKIGYSLGDFASCMFWQLIGMFLLYFYTDVFGISAAVAGTMFLITRIWDSVNDPIIGSIADRTDTRWGKFRPYLVWMALPFGIIGVLTFTTPDLSPTGKIVYAYITYLLMGMVYTAINIPYGALMGVMTSNSLERTSISSFKFIGAFLGGIFIQLLTLPLVKQLGRGNEALGFQLTAAIYAVIAVVLFILTFLSTKERIHPPVNQKSSLGKDLKNVLGNGPWLVLFFVSLSMLIFMSIRNAAGIYYFKYYVGDTKYVGYFLALGSAGSLIGVLCTKWCSSLVGKRNFFIVLTSLAALLTVVYYFFKPDDFALIFICQALFGLVTGPPFVLLWAMYADIADYSEWKTGRRATGLVFSAASFAQKMGWTLGGAISGWILAFYGFKANVVQDVGSQHGIKLIMSVIPFIPCLLAVVILFFYRLNEEKMQDIERELKMRRLTSGKQG
jgi:GPH family glycoside/pentoside/hexuronide:cation symporter